MSRTTHDRPGRVGQQVQQVVAQQLTEGLKDPTIEGLFVTVTQVKMTPDLREARIFFSVFGDAAAKKRAGEALARARGMLKRAIARDLKLRLTPELHFHYDESVEGADRIEQLLRSVRGGGG